jgi:hypothetical protein
MPIKIIITESLSGIIPVVWSDNNKIMCGYGSRNTTVFVILLDV